MKCPVCAEVQLVMADRQGIEIDYCPQCRGVWLDRGELDKIIERSTAQMQPAAGEQPWQPESRPGRAADDRSYHDDRDYRDDRDDQDDRDDRDDRDGRGDNDHYRRRRKRGGFFGDLFDFD